MTTKILFPHQGLYDQFSGLGTMFLGRNGAYRSQGIEVSENVSTLVMTPITTRGRLARCWIELPRDPDALLGVANALYELAVAIQHKQSIKKTS